MQSYQQTDEGQAWLNVLKSSQLAYPSEFVVRFLARVRNRLPLNCNALDMGFGSGQHLKLFTDYKLNAWGTELLDHAMLLGEEILKGQQYAGKLIKGDLDHLDLPKDAFGVFLNWGSLFFETPEKMRQNFFRIHDLLIPGGVALFNVRTLDNWFYGLGKEGPRSHWHLDSRAGAFSNCRYTFLDAREIVDLIRGTGLEIENIERNEFWKNNLSERHSWWIVQARRNKSVSISD